MMASPVCVTSAIEIAAPRSAVWARLCDAEMPATAPCEFRLGPFGPPRPLRCELPEGVGGVGATRRCVSERGTVLQRVTEWRTDERLAFELAPGAAGGTRLTRRTELVPRGPCPRLRGLALAVALRRVHRFTMRGFRHVVEAA